jgi:hypothetical protein
MYTHIYVYDKFVIVGPFEGTGVGGREKDNIEIHFIVYEDGTMKHTEVC